MQYRAVFAVSAPDCRWGPESVLAHGSIAAGLDPEIQQCPGVERSREDAPGPPVRTQAFSVGRPLVADVDDVAGALARSEGEAFR